MTTRVYCSLDESRLGIQVYEPQVKRGIAGETKFFRTKEYGNLRWRHIHKPSIAYVEARKIFDKRICTGHIYMQWGKWVERRKIVVEDTDNRCAVLAAKLFNPAMYKRYK